MNEDLSALVRAAAHDEAGAAEREFPYSSATLGRLVGDVRRRRSATAALLAVAGAAVIGLATLGLVQLGQHGQPPVFPVPIATSPTTSAPTAPSTEPTTPTTPSTEPTTPTTPSTEPTTTTAPAPDPTTPTTTAPAPDPTTPPPPSPTATVAAPGRVTGVHAGSGGGSGEIYVSWDTIPDATGYRVYRSTAASGPFVASASIDVATGKTSIEFAGGYEFIGIWAPSWGGFEYDEAVYVSGPGYFRVTAFNSGGEGPPSSVVCGSPPGYPTC
jgi:hypothetical protein